MKYYTIKVEILVESKDENTAKDIIENLIDDIQQKNKEVQDFQLVLN